LTVKDLGGLQGTADSAVYVSPNTVSNNPPSVTITSPSDGASLASGASVSFAGSAADPEDGDLTSNLVWTSDQDGQIGTGGSFSAVLSNGVHTITAEVTDSGGSINSDGITVTVESTSGGDFTLSVDAYKIKGDKYAYLTWIWSGEINANVDVYCNGNKIATTNNDGAYTHGPFSKGKPKTYQVCEAGTLNCSNEITVSW
jgi:hypothetical protein